MITTTKEFYPYTYPFTYSDVAFTALIAEQKKMSVRPVLSMAVAGGSTYGTDRILRADRVESHNSHKTELVLQDSDGVMTALDLKGKKLTPSWGLITSAGSETAKRAPLWVRDQRLDSAQGRRVCNLTCIGIPDRLAEDKANDDYSMHKSSVKTVKDIITEIASGTAVTEELSEVQEDGSASFNIKAVTFNDEAFTCHGIGQRLSIPNRLVTKLSFRLKKVGNPTGDITFILYDVAGSAAIESKVLADASTLTTSFAWYTVTFDTPTTINKLITVEGGVRVGGIWAYFTHTDGTATDYIVAEYSSSDVKSSEHLFVVHSTGSVGNAWESASDDMIYRYYYTGAGISVYDHCAAWTATFDSEDSLIDVYYPADAFIIRQGEIRLGVIDKLLAYTGCERYFENDEEIHIKVPTTSGVSYDYEYALDTGHTFFSKSVRNSLVIPSKVVVESFPDDTTQYSGNYTSATSYALLPINDYLRTKLISNAQATAIATARIAHIEVASQRGSATVPMNVGAEIWDYVKVTDERASDSRIGNIGYLHFHYDSGNTPDSYKLTFGFGGVPTKSVPGTRLSELYDGLFGLDLQAAIDPSVKWGILLPHLRLYAEAIDKLQEAQINVLIGLDYWNSQTSTDDKIETALIGYMQNVIDDAAPQLGGDLDLNGRKLIGLTASIEFVIDGGGSAITTGEKGHLQVPFACTINSVTTLADQSGSIVVDIWKDTYANFPPADADSITASAPPTITTATKSTDTTLTGWTTAITADDILAYNVDSITTCTRVTIILDVTRT